MANLDKNLCYIGSRFNLHLRSEKGKEHYIVLTDGENALRVDVNKFKTKKDLFGEWETLVRAVVSLEGSFNELERE